LRGSDEAHTDGKAFLANGQSPSATSITGTPSVFLLRHTPVIWSHELAITARRRRVLSLPHQARDTIPGDRRQRGGSRAASHQMRRQRESDAKRGWRSAMGLIKKTALLRCHIIRICGGFLAGFGAAIFFAQCVGWLTTGIWISIEFQDLWQPAGWHQSSSDTAGLPRLLDFPMRYVTTFPLPLAFMLIGSIAYLLGASGLQPGKNLPHE
jgi:hypothetical protein